MIDLFKKSSQPIDLENITIRDFEKIFKTHYPVLCGFANKYLNDYDLAEEMVQDIFYTLWKNREFIKINTSEKAYLFTAVKNKCFQYFEHKKVEQKYEHYIQLSNSAYVGDPTEELHYSEMYSVFEKTLASLPEKCRTIFKLNRFEGLKYSEISEKLSVPVKTVEANMSRALKLLRINLQSFADSALLILLFLNL